MNTHQKNTYLVYGRGIDLNRLKLGSLFLDPANPLERSPFIFDLQDDALKTWTGGAQEDVPCSLEFTASRGWLTSFNLLSLIGANASQDSNNQLEVQGDSGARYQLSEPENFLNELVLTSEDARAWLTSRLAVSRRIYYSKKVIGKAPKIWMLTGVQRITKGSVTFGQGSAGTKGGNFTLPFPEPTTGALLAPAGKGTVMGKMDVQHKADRESRYDFGDERVWAAQFMRVDVHVGKEIPEPDAGQSAKKWIKLRQLDDLKKEGTRNNKQAEEKVSEYVDLGSVGVAGLSDDPGKDIAHDLSDVDWELVDLYLDYILNVPEDDEDDSEDEDEEEEKRGD